MLLKNAEAIGGKIVSFLKTILPVRLLSCVDEEQNIIKRKKREEMKFEKFLPTKHNHVSYF